MVLVVPCDKEALLPHILGRISVQDSILEAGEVSWKTAQKMIGISSLGGGGGEG